MSRACKLLSVILVSATLLPGSVANGQNAGRVNRYAAPQAITPSGAVHGPRAPSPLDASKSPRPTEELTARIKGWTLLCEPEEKDLTIKDLRSPTKGTDAKEDEKKAVTLNDRFVSFDPRVDALWPGAILRGDSISDGQLAPVIFPRAPVLLTITGLTSGEANRKWYSKISDLNPAWLKARFRTWYFRGAHHIRQLECHMTNAHFSILTTQCCGWGSTRASLVRQRKQS